MPTKRARKPRNIVPNISETALWAMSDGLYPKPEGGLNEWELLVDRFGYPSSRYADMKAVWDENKASILADWIRAHPGTRPRWWWDFDAPRMSQAEIEARGWTECFFAEQEPEPRKRLGGTGDPDYEHLAMVPRFECGIPVGWIDQETVDMYNGRTINIRTGELVTCNGKWFEGHFVATALDPDDPPRFESQASYLDRHGLLSADERRRLPKDAFEPETITLEEEAVTQ